ncbi:centrosomal protein of 152 kDa-like [Polyodon spathula]|uniref:centrosomal protein of 152 kDa-like n=1 Tax=Polyodon spathula TaxID=7913 RepID=UPI001B7F7180|nr:centrosomal protein of 152 kDa-like [Polyodon spathula]
MSIDFDSVALQTQHEEEYDREDYAREQELQKLLTDLPDDMLEDSRDVSSPELNYSGCSANGTSGSSICFSVEDYEDGYIQDQYHEEYFNRNDNEHVNHGEPHGNGWSEQQEGEDEHRYMYNHIGYEYLNTDAQDVAGSKDYSIDERVEQDPYVQTNPYHLPGTYQQHAEGPREAFSHDDQNVQRHQYQCVFSLKQGFIETGNLGDKPMDDYKVNYNRHLPAVQPKTFNAKVNNKDAKFEQMQIEFLYPGTNSTETQRIAQFQVLYKARGRQLEELQQKLEDCGRHMRYLNHQLAIAKDEKKGLAVTLQESGKLIKDGKEKEVQLLGQIKALEFQVQTLTANEEKNLENQNAAEAALDSMQQQMTELCHSESLTRARVQHKSILAALKEKHEDKVLALQQKLDAQSHAVEEQKEICHRLREQIKQQERQQEEAKLEKVEIINRLTKSLEESQQQCTNLLQTGTVQELNQLRYQLHQAQSAKNISDSMNKSLQEELGELNEQITLYESAGKFGVLSTDPCGDSEAPMSDSYVELGIKNVNWKSTKFHRYASSVGRTDKSMSKDDIIMDLKAELERFLGSFKVKRQKITQLQDELRQSQRQVQELKTQLEKAEKNAKDHEVGENGLEKQLEISVTDKAVKEEVERLQRENQCLQQVIEKLRHQIKELSDNKEMLKLANQELCTEMRKMMQDFDQDKQETTERYEKIHQQHREDIVSHLRGELLQEHALEKEQLTQLYEEKIHSLEVKLSDLNREMVRVQECYITVCKENNLLEEDLRGKLEQEMALKENELKKQFSEENKISLESFKSELEEKLYGCQEQEKEELLSCSKHYIQKLEKSCNDLRKNLEKACRQLQQTVRENKANVHNIKAEYEEAIKKEREEGLRRVQEVKASGKTAATRSQFEDESEPCIQKGLEEIQEQYLRAVCKIRGDMLRYIQASKARAAEMIRVEVLRERQETARKMRTYYLTCLQQLLEDGGKNKGAEQKIMNAASKLAALAKKCFWRNLFLFFISQIKGQEQEKEELLSCSKHYIQKLEKSCNDLRKNLEKACRQLQQTVRENKANVHNIKAEYEEAIKKEREEGLRRVQEVKASGKTAATRSQFEDESEPCIQKGLEEIQEQYLRAVCKIRGDMLRYIQASKARAAEMIRVEVLRERQETARKMRTYYLTCLQQLLEDGGKNKGAEQKIMNAASKLAALAKVLEMPAPNRKCNKKEVTGVY